MKKKSLLLGLAAVALAMTFIACDTGISNPDDISNTEKAASLSGPANLAAKAYPGVNLITWDVQKDAASYSVFRKDTVTGASKEVGVYLSPDTTQVVDAVTDQNLLINGRTYTYTVIANSGQSTSGRALDGDSIIFDGASSANVTANIPERGTVVAVPSEGDISIESKSIDGADFFVVKWNSGEENFNSYTVGYVYDVSNKEVLDVYNVANGTYAGSGNEVFGHLAREKYVALPAIGGTPKLTFRVDGSFYSSNSYYSDAHVLKTFTAPALTALEAVTSFSVTREGSNVRLQWDNVENATGYDIYKAEKAADGTNALVGAWTTVAVGATTQGQNKVWTALEQNVPATKNYRYLIIAKNGTMRSKASKDADINTSSSPGISANLGVAVLWRTNKESSAVVTWNYQLDATYKLERAEAILVENNLVAIEAYKPLTLVSNASSYVDSEVKQRHSYIYKLTVTLEGVTKEFTTELNADPYSIRPVANLVVTSSTKTINAITVKFDTSSPDLSAELWRQEVTSSGSGQIGNPVKVSDPDLKPGDTFEDTGLTPGSYYKYKRVLKSTLNALQDDNRLFGNGDLGVLPSNAGSDFVNTFSSETPTLETEGSNNYFVYDVQTQDYYNDTTAPLLKGAQLYKMTSTGNTFVWNAKTEAGIIRYNTSSSLSGIYQNVGQYHTYFSVSTPDALANSSYEDIYFVLGSNGLPHGITYNTGSGYSGSVDVVKITRTYGSKPTSSSASWETVYASSIQW